ncbi:MAG TPA: exo-beta-N-acetylmuramidase NamZ domain-containing protein [Methylomirabilota bacterium]|nr:exo-beta-N-acetylmuramidase NamZ domain-containing protein [Methylomirabilota bacterium]
MLRRAAALLAAFLLFPAAAAAQSLDWSDLDLVVRESVAGGDTPGAVILVGQGNRVLYRKALGSRAVTPAVEPMTTDTIFDIASLTKVVATTPAILALVDDRKLALDAPLGRYLKEFQGPPLAWLTVRRVLTHTAGFADLPSSEAMAKGLPDGMRLLAAGVSEPSPTAPFRYSDTGFIVLAELVRRVSGEPLDRFTRKRFYQPLGMRDTTFNPPAAWRARIAPTEFFHGQMLRGVVHDPRALQLHGVAGHAGLFSTADDLGRFCRMLLGDGMDGGRRYLSSASVHAMFAPNGAGEATRGLGWDMASNYSRTLGSFFPMGSVGHTGFTGTSILMDPPTRTYVIILANPVHPAGKGSVFELRRRVSAIVGVKLLAPNTVPVADEGETQPAARATGDGLSRIKTRTGLDVLEIEDWAQLKGRVIGLVTNQTGVDAEGRRNVDLLAKAQGVRLQAVFSPEHGLDGALDARVSHGTHPATGLTIWSLYGSDRRPTATMLRGLDTLVFDIQDVGVRFYTYLTTLVYILEEAASHHISVVVLDRPNPLTGVIVEGPVMDADLRSFTAPHPIPVRSGMTLGEFAKMVAGERKIPVTLTVVPLEHWERSMWFDQTGLPWVNPSPNIRSLTEALLYPGVGLLEATNLSVGRGTATPFEVVGAPWITDPGGLADALNAAAMPGVTFQPLNFQPDASVYSGQLLGGVRLVVTDRDALRPVTVGLTIGRALLERYPRQFRATRIQNLLVNRSTIWALLRGDSLARLKQWAEADRASFLQRRASYLIYK